MTFLQDNMYGIALVLIIAITFIGSRFNWHRMKMRRLQRKADRAGKPLHSYRRPRPNGTEVRLYLFEEEVQEGDKKGGHTIRPRTFIGRDAYGKFKEELKRANPEDTLGDGSELIPHMPLTTPRELAAQARAAEREPARLHSVSKAA